LSSAALVLLAAGGIVYSLGVIFFVWERLPYQTAIWHAFVLAGTACHFAAVTLAVGV
jgi:hemolysin III